MSLSNLVRVFAPTLMTVDGDPVSVVITSSSHTTVHIGWCQCCTCLGIVWEHSVWVLLCRCYDKALQVAVPGGWKWSSQRRGDFSSVLFYINYIIMLCFRLSKLLWRRSKKLTSYRVEHQPFLLVWTFWLEFTLAPRMATPMASMYV